MTDAAAPNQSTGRTLLRWLRWPAAVLLLAVAGMCVYWFPAGPPGVLVTPPQALAACAVIACALLATLLAAWE